MRFFAPKRGKKGRAFFFHTLSLLKGPRGKQEEDFLLFLIPCLVLCPSAIILCRERRGKNRRKPPRRVVLLFAAVAFFFF